mmetsp:Transcript_33077/g.95478  ORF Transcript_33077/g.95478 Transcript_33077/m.95478 type:complete len:229 (+) Transcript_33077:236-922(+)
MHTLTSDKMTKKRRLTVPAVITAVMPISSHTPTSHKNNTSTRPCLPGSSQCPSCRHHAAVRDDDGHPGRPHRPVPGRCRHLVVRAAVASSHLLPACRADAVNQGQARTVVELPDDAVAQRSRGEPPAGRDEEPAPVDVLLLVVVDADQRELPGVVGRHQSVLLVRPQGGEALAHSWLPSGRVCGGGVQVAAIDGLGFDDRVDVGVYIAQGVPLAAGVRVARVLGAAAA